MKAVLSEEISAYVANDSQKDACLRTSETPQSKREQMNSKRNPWTIKGLQIHFKSMLDSVRDTPIIFK